MQPHLCLLTLQSHHTADHNDVSSFPFLHIRHHFLDHADHPKEICLKDFLHLFDGDAFHWTHEADTRIVDCSGEEANRGDEEKISNLGWSIQGAALTGMHFTH